MHCTVSGCGDVLVEDEDAAIAPRATYLSYMPSNWREHPRGAAAPPMPGVPADRRGDPAEAERGFDIMEVIRRWSTRASCFEIKRALRPRARHRLRRASTAAPSVSSPAAAVKGGVLFVDSADKAARFIYLCDAFNIPLLCLADVPGFMIGTEVERQGIIRHGAKMIAAL